MVQMQNHSKKELVLGFDDNLGLPNDFSEKVNLKIKSYHEFAPMLEDFKKGKVTLIFLPVGTLPYVGHKYELIAQASFRIGGTNRIDTKLVTAKNLTLEDVSKAKIGRINPYCTTSFWALLIYLKNRCPKGTKIDFIETNGFQDLLFKIAAQEVDVAMVWDVILQNNPDATKKVHELGSHSNLPTPVIIANSPIPEKIKHAITHFKSEDPSPLFFNRFTDVDLELINTFKEQMKQASTYFNLGL